MDGKDNESQWSVDSAPRHEHLLNELEDTEVGGVSNVIRAVYDEEEHGRFMERLEARIRAHDKEIERMCNHHYQGFIDSVRGLLEVRSQVQNLQCKVVGVKEELETATAPLLEKAKELNRARRVQRNASAAIQQLQACLPVFHMYSKLQNQVNEKRYYPALRTLEQLENSYLNELPSYKFVQQMRESIPKYRDTIKKAATAELKDFLESIRKVQPKIGEVALRHVAEEHGIDSGLVGANKPELYESLSESQTDYEEELSAQDLVDFSPVYRALHIHSALGEREQFKSYYRRQRMQQAKLALQAPTYMHETLEGYRKYFHAVVGFFVAEDHLLNTASGLVTRQYLDEVWEMSLSSLTNTLRTHTSYCTDVNLLLQIKNMIMLFSHTLRRYGYGVNSLFDLLLEIRDHYNEVLMQRWVQVFREIFDEDNYQPIEVDTTEEYHQITAVFPYKNEELECEPFPKAFPFSLFVPKVYSQVKAFIHVCLKFSEDLNLSQTEVDDMVRKSTNLLLKRTLSGCLSALIKKPNLSLQQLIQITNNTRHLEDATQHLEAYIQTVTGSPYDRGHGAMLAGRELMQDVRADAEEQLCEALRSRLNEFVELAQYDWLLQEPTGHASSYVTDLIAFLHSTFLSFTDLSQRLAQTACMSSCQHIAKALISLLLDDSVKQLSLGAIEQLNLDVIQCEHFALSEPVEGFEEGMLQMCFADLRQLLDLLMTADWSSYLHDFGRDSAKYARVKPQHVVTILEKLREGEKKTMFSAMKKSERDKKKLLETVLKQLKQLIANTTMS